jgi:hypothetical protein
MPCKVWPLEVDPALHRSQVKCTVQPKAAGFTRIRVTEEPNVGMMQVKPTAKDFTKCKDQIFISLFPRFKIPTYHMEKVGGVLW